MSSRHIFAAVLAGLIVACSAPAEREPDVGVEGDTIEAPTADDLAPFVVLEADDLASEDDVTVQEVSTATTTAATSTTTLEPVEDETKVCEHLRFQGPTFDSNSAEFSPEGEARVRHLAGWLIDRDQAAAIVGIDVHGHTDDVSSSRPGGNQQLSEGRARAVADVLSERGLPVERVVGFADEEPRVDGADAETRAANRRVEVIVTCEASR